MLDVHPPEHGIHGTRDFVVHLLTITVGLLIALGLENAAEALHHRHQRHEAETIITEELMHNREHLTGILKSTDGTHTNMIHALHYLVNRRDGKPADASGISFAFGEGPLESTGWKTAVTTGTLSYMDPAEVQRFAGAYQEQQLFEDAESRALIDVERLDSYALQSEKPEAFNAQDIESAIPDVRTMIADLGAMQDVGRGTLEAYETALQK